MNRKAENIEVVLVDIIIENTNTYSSSSIALIAVLIVMVLVILDLFVALVVSLVLSFCEGRVTKIFPQINLL